MTKQEIIESLTPGQEASLESYYEKWLAIGMRAGPTTEEERKQAEDAVIRAYKVEGLEAPKFVWTRSPMEGAQRCLELGDEKSNLIYSAGYGSHDANWLGFYDFMMNELGLKEDCDDLVPLMDLAKVGGWWWPYENVCVMSERPMEIHVNDRGDIHNFTGPGVLYADGFAIYAFNGIEVPQQLADKPADKITKNDFLKQENADIRREISNKIGIQRTMELLGAEVADKLTCSVGGKYELIMVNYDDRGKRPYLKMGNPSINADHIEGVLNGVTTVEKALCYRNGLKKWVAPQNLS